MGIHLSVWPAGNGYSPLCLASREWVSTSLCLASREWVSTSLQTWESQVGQKEEWHPTSVTLSLAKFCSLTDTSLHRDRLWDKPFAFSEHMRHYASHSLSRRKFLAGKTLVMIQLILALVWVIINTTIFVRADTSAGRFASITKELSRQGAVLHPYLLSLVNVHDQTND